MSILDFVAGCAGYCSVWLQKSHDGGYMAAYPRKLEPLKTTTSLWNLVWKGIMHSITWSNHCSLNIKTARKKKRLKITETVQAMARFGSKPIAREMRTLQTHIIYFILSCNSNTVKQISLHLTEIIFQMNHVEEQPRIPQTSEKNHLEIFLSLKFRPSQSHGSRTCFGSDLVHGDSSVSPWALPFLWN